MEWCYFYLHLRRIGRLVPCHPLLGLCACRLAGACEGQVVDVEIMAGQPVVGEHLPACVFQTVGVGMLGEQDNGLAELRILGARDHEGRPEDGLQGSLHLLGLHLDAAGVDDIVETAEDAELSLRVDEGTVVGDERALMYQGCVDDETAVGVEADGHGVEGRVPVGGIGTAEAPEGDVGERLRHAVGAPHGVGKGLQLACQLVVDGASADDELPDGLQPPRLLGHAEGVVDLQGHHGGEGEAAVGGGIELPGISAQRGVAEGMAAGLHADELQTALEAAHDNHLAGDIVERHAEQGRVAGTETEEVARDAGGGEHAPLLHLHRLGSARRAARVDGDGGRRTVPLGEELL